VHISDDLVCSEREHSCFVLQTKLRFLYWKFDMIRSLYINASFIICVISLLSFANSLLCSKKQKEYTVVPPITRSIGLQGNLAVGLLHYRMHYGYGKSPNASDEKMASLSGNFFTVRLAVRCSSDNEVNCWTTRSSKTSLSSNDLVIRGCPKLKVLAIRCKTSLSQILEVLAIGYVAIGWPRYPRYHCSP
jgi:hypothetical protein